MSRMDVMVYGIGMSETSPPEKWPYTEPVITPELALSVRELLVSDAATDELHDRIKQLECENKHLREIIERVEEAIGDKAFFGGET